MGSFTPRKYSWYSFLLEAKSTPGQEYSWKDHVNTPSGIKLAILRLAA
jgi:hypothetical protein